MGRISLMEPLLLFMIIFNNKGEGNGKKSSYFILLHGGSYNRWCHNYHCFGIILVGEWHKIFIVTQKYHIGTSLGTWLIPIRPALRLFAPEVALRNYPH